MIKMITGREVIDAVNAIQGLDVPIKMKYALQKTMRDLRDAFELLENNRQDLVVQFGEKKEDGDYHIDASDKAAQKKYRAALDKMRSEKFEIDAHVIKLSYIEEHRVNLTVAQVMALAFMLEDDL